VTVAPESVAADAGAVLVCALEGQIISEPEREFFRRVSPAGVTLFGRNVSIEQQSLAELTCDLQSIPRRNSAPLVIAIDQEGGRVARLKAPFPNAGSAMQLAAGHTSSEALGIIRGIAEDMGRKLRTLGINVNFAPVCDVLTEPTNTAIGDRAFGTNPAAVTQRAGAFLAGLQVTGVLGCLKHFPGQGAAKVDTHAAAATIDAAAATLRTRDLAPFQALLPQAAMVMISHCIYPQLAAEEAGRSTRIMRDLLRGDLGFGGVVVSDDMNMGAVPQERAEWAAAIVESIAAGADMLLVCRHLERCELAYQTLRQAAEKSATFRSRLAEAAARVRLLRQKLF